MPADTKPPSATPDPSSELDEPVHHHKPIYAYVEHKHFLDLLRTGTWEEWNDFFRHQTRHFGEQWLPST